MRLTTWKATLIANTRRVVADGDSDREDNGSLYLGGRRGLGHRYLRTSEIYSTTGTGTVTLSWYILAK